MNLNFTAQGLSRIQARTLQVRRLAGIGSERGLVKAGLILQRAANAIVPVDMGPLKASSYCRKISGSGFKTVVAVGYTASYAGVVHENMDLAHGQLYNLKYSRQIAAREKYYRRDLGRWVRYHNRGPNQQAHYLQNALAWNFKAMQEAVRQQVAQQLSLAASNVGEIASAANVIADSMTSSLQ